MDQGNGSAVRISTPEAVSFTIDTAGVGARFVAAAIDTFFISVTMSIVSFFLLIVYGIFSVFQGDENLVGHMFDTARYLIMALLILSMFLIIWGYYIYFEYAHGGVTPGKRVAGIKVVKADGSPLTFSDVAIRNLIRIIDFMPSFYIAGIISIAASRKNQRLGDLAAGTLVVHVREGSYMGRAQRFGQPSFHGNCRVPLDPREYETISSFLTRRREFHPWRRALLSARLASSVSLKYDLPLERFPDNETMLLWLFADGQDYVEAACTPVAAPEPAAGQAAAASPLELHATTEISNENRLL